MEEDPLPDTLPDPDLNAELFGSDDDDDDQQQIQQDAEQPVDQQEQPVDDADAPGLVMRS